MESCRFHSQALRRIDPTYMLLPHTPGRPPSCAGSYCYCRSSSSPDSLSAPLPQDCQCCRRGRTCRNQASLASRQDNVIVSVATDDLSSPLGSPPSRPSTPRILLPPPRIPLHQRQSDQGQHQRFHGSGASAAPTVVTPASPFCPVPARSGRRARPSGPSRSVSTTERLSRVRSET